MFRRLSVILRGLAALLLGALLGAPAWSAGDGPQAAGPSGLRELRATLRPKLAANPFGGPLHLDSKESPRTLQGDVYAVVDHPFAALSAALSDPGNWCDVLILHLNVKHCRRRSQGPDTRLELRIGRKHDQPLASATLATFSFRTVAATPDYLDVQLEAPEGPFDTSDYRILLEAIPIETGRTFIHMGYSFAYGNAGRLAMQMYLSTIGRNKVGFTAARPVQPGQPPEYVGGLRGMVERNTMRYYLAIDAYLAAVSAPPAERFERRIAAWHAATERHPRQLRELDREAYLAMKRAEYERQQSSP
ncbi:MAG: hypothetical protein NDJ19_06890 [Ramlibacter sp.]|nr:hypothetical protein [Ramlibacter sp.]